MELLTSGFGGYALLPLLRSPIDMLSFHEKRMEGVKYNMFVKRVSPTTHITHEGVVAS